MCPSNADLAITFQLLTSVEMIALADCTSAGLRQAKPHCSFCIVVCQTHMFVPAAL